MSRQEKTHHMKYTTLRVFPANVRRNFSFRGAASSVIFMMSYLTACRYVVTRGRKVLSSSMFSPLPLFVYCCPRTPYMGKELVARTRAETWRGERWVNSATYRKKETKPCLLTAHSHSSDNIKDRITARPV